jgi:hypothetical protein
MTIEQNKLPKLLEADADARRERREALIKAYERRQQLRLEAIYMRFERKLQKLRDQIDRIRKRSAA